MRLHLDRLKELLKKRSIGGWILLIFWLFWRRLGDWQTIEWLADRLLPKDWPRYVPHPSYVTIILFCATLGWFTVIIIWPKKETTIPPQTKKPDESSSNKREIGGDALPDRLVPVLVKPIPVIEYVQTERKLLGQVPVMLALFRNIPNLERGQDTLTASDVTATLTYKNSEDMPGEEDGSGEAQIFVSFGTWLPSYTRYSTFDPGRTNPLIVSFRRDNKLWALDNASSTPPRFGQIPYNAPETEIPWNSFEVEILLVCKGTTLYHGWFLYEFDSSGETLRPISTQNP